MVFITETDYVYCTVRSESLSIFSLNFGPKRRAMPQAVSRQSLTAEVSVRSQVSQCEFCGGQSALASFAPGVLRFPPVSVIPTMLHADLYLRVAVTGSANGRSLGTC